MAKFCTRCFNLLTTSYTENDLTFMCNSCHSQYEAVASDTLRYEYVKEPDVMIFETILNKAGEDPVTIKAHQRCVNAKCGNEIIKQVRIGADLRLYNICVKCNAQWLN